MCGASAVRVLIASVGCYNEAASAIFNARDSMEKRQHPRIELPLLVEVMHPSLGTLETTARDISPTAVFVQLPDPQLREGASVRVRMKTPQVNDTQHTPTVDMQVQRLEEDGLVLAFKNRTAQHLWSSVERLRQELQPGRDYFQVYQSAVVQHPRRGVLVVQQHGVWTLPGHYLVVGQHNVDVLRSFCEDELGLSLSGSPETLSASAHTHESLVEAATLCITYACETATDEVRLASSEYKAWRWIHRAKDADEVTLESDAVRALVKARLEAQESARGEDQSGQGA